MSGADALNHFLDMLAQNDASRRQLAELKIAEMRACGRIIAIPQPLLTIPLSSKYAFSTPMSLSRGKDLGPKSVTEMRVIGRPLDHTSWGPVCEVKHRLAATVL
jgi:hypothetical protein